MDMEPQSPTQNDHGHEGDLTALPTMPQHLRTDSIDSATSTANSSDTATSDTTTISTSNASTNDSTASSFIASSTSPPPSPISSNPPSEKSCKQVRFDPEPAQTSFFDWDSEDDRPQNPLQTARLRFNGSNIRRTLSTRPSTPQVAKVVVLTKPAKPVKSLGSTPENGAPEPAEKGVKVRGESGEFSAWLAKRAARGVELLPEREGGLGPAELVGPAELMEPAADSARARRRKGEAEGIEERVLGKRRSFVGLFGRK